MNKIFFVFAVAFTALILSGCGKSHKEIVPWVPAHADLRFDKDTVDLMITPQSDEFSIGFHKSNDPIPENIKPTMTVDIADSTVELGTQVTFPDYSERVTGIEAVYDATGNKGSIKIKVHPKAITKPLHLTLVTLGIPNSKVVINLIPAQ